MRYYLLFLLILFFSSVTLPITLILDPHGDAGCAGRVIRSNKSDVPDMYERSISLQLAQAIKKEIECRVPYHKILITRVAGERLPPLQQANFANRIQADLLVHLSFYQDQSVTPHLDLYQFFYEPVLAVPPPYAWISYDQASRRSYAATERYLNYFGQFLRENQRGSFEIERFNFPYKPLIGIQVPAFAIEMGVKNGAEWQSYVMPICDALISLMEQVR